MAFRATGTIPNAMQATFMKRGATLFLAMVGALITSALSMSAQATVTSFEDVSASVGLDVEREPCTTSGWFDIDGDGFEEPIWVASDGIQAVVMDENGSLQHTMATVNSASFSKSDKFVQPVLLAGDFDKDGERDLLVINERISFYKRVAPFVFDELPLYVPPLPVAGFVSDAAVGDLNMDGWPDILLSTARRQAGHLHSKGAFDLILMNHHGVFEVEAVKPLRTGEGHGVTIVDMNDDGVVDIVESVDFAQVVGGSRILINATPPGASSATFSDVQVYDEWGYGMGAAVADIDEDGYLDVYNTSAGRDFLYYGTESGEFEDRTLERGITHHTGDESVRIQWSPTITDFNGDGLQDVYVRHDNLFIFGGPNNNIISTELLALKPQTCLLYEQQADGHFIRRSLPFDPMDFSGGVDASVGDADRDGRPDIIQGTVRQEEYITIMTRGYLWLNTTPETATNHSVVISLKGTVGIDPPMGANIEATCSGVTKRRLLTSGGKMGGLSGSNVHIAWPNCDGSVEATIRWPSGVHSTHTIEAGSRYTLISEPQWLTFSDSDEGWMATLYPDLIDEASACIHHTGTDQWECCEEACTKSLNPLAPNYDRVRAGSEGPEFALPVGPSHLSLTTEPKLPIPNEPFTLRVNRTHPLAGIAEEEAPWLRVDGTKIPWTKEDHEQGVYETELLGADGGEELSVTLFRGAKTVQKMALPSGYSLDPRDLEYVLYPTQDPSGSGAWRVLMTPSVGLEEVDKSHISARLSDGTPVNTQVLPAGSGRLAADVTWDLITPGMGLTIYDKDIPRSELLPATPIASHDEFVEQVAGVRGYFSRHDMVEGGDSSILYLTLLNSEGHPLPPDPESVVLESKDLIVASKPARMSETIRNWDLRAVIRTKLGVGEATIRVLRSDGLFLREFTVQVRPSLELPVSMTESSLALSHQSIPAGVGATATLHIYARNEWREFVGLDAKIRAETKGPLRLLSPVVASDGHTTVTVEAGYFGGEWPIDVYLNDTYLDSVTLAVVGPAPPSDNPTVNWPENDDIQPHSDVSTPSNPTDSSPTGCNAGGKPIPLYIPWLMILGVFATRFVRTR